jgi:sulfatase modifying factor 1
MRIFLSFLYSLILIFSACNREAPVAPEGMVYIEGGKATIGSDTGFPNESPEFTMKIESFFMDVNPVTIADFREFVIETGHVTSAEEFGNSTIYDFDSLKWELVDGATWEYPLGSGSEKAADNHPVTHVSWFDANAYAEWAGKRLPTEFEWEYAARKGIPKDQRYTWGNDLKDQNGYNANVWQGTFPGVNKGLDGFFLTSPVGQFGANINGLTDMGGNVWEWCSNVYAPYENSPEKFRILEENKSLRGGSFMCDSSFCHGYIVSHRNYTTSESSLFHTGFRCVKDISTD